MNQLQLLVKGDKKRPAKNVRALHGDWQVASLTGIPLHAGEAWEQAYEAAARDNLFAEPDFNQPYLFDRAPKPPTIAAKPGEAGEYDYQDPSFPMGQGFAWHLNKTELDQARQAIDKLGAKRSPVRIGILDVGFDFNHQALPKTPLLRLDLQRNFASGNPKDASDPYDQGLLHQNNPGHGTGTLSILAGGKLENMQRSEQNGIILGGNPFAEIIPCRIASSVVLAKTSAFVDAVRYLMAPNGDPALRADVISMSMGGLASEAWADIVNAAYEAGIVIVTAAGNNFGAPKAIVYPARFNRVIAACGVMANDKPYIAGAFTMSGNFGPDSKMKSAISAYTPNVPWAEVNAHNIVDMNGAGTSSATPQVAAAASLWLQKYKSTLAGKQPWQVVEAVREALFNSARLPSEELRKYLGHGILRAFKALADAPVIKSQPTAPDVASWEFFKLLEKPFGMAATVDPQAPLERMLNLELTQLFQREPVLEQILPDPARGVADAATRTKLLQAVAESRNASKVLRDRCKAALSSSGPAAVASAAPVSTRFQPKVNQPIVVRSPQVRRLRAYGFDPSLSTRLETMRLNQVTMEIPWEPLTPGPVGEYIEVVDHDPATGCFYEPVNLNHEYLLASDGLAPSEGSPQFHQQMVYAVAMRTIYNFEKALGRKAQWSSKGDGFVQRLRIYPHALRAQNAYYHPGKKALLFGYFPAESGDPSNILPGGVVFTCLSHDVVAHETTHALLDGMYSHFNHPSNADLLAFHEAFADIVAVFQHFSLPGVLEERIAAVGGSLRTDKLMGDLAQEFGRGAGLHASLRTALSTSDKKDDEQIDKRIYEVWEPHDRGAILLGAIFDAFIRIYELRSKDLIRLAMAGREELPKGPVNRDLAARLAEEAGKAAQHVLNMCIRALDYCPPVDLNFGDYLRAIITADSEIMPTDEHGYRIAFLEAFRARGIYPRGVRSMSVESLLWKGPIEERGSPLLKRMGGSLERIREFSDKFKRFYTRVKMHGYSSVKRREFEADLKAMDPADLRQLGLDPDRPFQVTALRLSEKQGQYGRNVPQVILSVTQHREVSLNADGSGPKFNFEGGATIIIDPQFLKVTYVISKNTLSESRLKMQRNYLLDPRRSLRDLYFGDDPNQRFAMLHKKELV